MKPSELKRFAAAAKQEGILIEVEKDGMIVRFYPNDRPETAREPALNPWDAARLARDT